MRYYCNVCKKDITPGEFSYSKDQFGKPLCREHQEVERRNQGGSIPVEKQVAERMEREPVVPKSEEATDLDDTNENEKAPKSRWKSFGKGIIKGVRGIASSLKKRSQMRKWKTSILRRLTMPQLERLCFEKGVSTTKHVLAEDNRSEEIYIEKVKCSQGGLVSRLRSKLSFDAITSFAERNHIDIRDILQDKAQTDAQWEEKELAERIKENGTNKFLLELEKTIGEFVPPRRYDKEFYYQDTLYSFLKSKFPDIKIEVPRGSTRPDIVVKGIGIEIKGPTNKGELTSIIEKCGRYLQYFPKGLICVLFDVTVTQQYYDDWFKGMKKIFPDVKIIKKDLL